MPPCTARNFPAKRAMIACAVCEGPVRSSNGFNETIINAEFGWL
jgi:hypothetical protein